MRLPVSEYTPRACRYTLSQTRSLAGVKPRVGVYRGTTKLLATYAKVRLTPSSFRWICKSGVETSRRCSNARRRSERREIRFDEASPRFRQERSMFQVLWVWAESLVRNVIYWNTNDLEMIMLYHAIPGKHSTNIYILRFYSPNFNRCYCVL